MNQTILDECWSKIGPQQNRTKCPYHRVRNLFTHCSNYIDNSIEGDFVEVGTWKGGCSALMGKMCDLEGKNRKVWALDSFEGMSPPDSSVDLLEGESKAEVCFKPEVQLHNFNLQDFEDTCFKIVGVNRNTMKIHKGWVENTLPSIEEEVHKISILRINVDWYEPTLQVLEYLYDKVIPGGVIICDDYGAWKGARLAIDEFREKRGIISPIQQTPADDFSSQPSLLVGTEHFWIKD